MGSRDWWVHQLQAQRGGEHGHLNPIFFVMPSRRCVAALRHRAAYGMGELRHHQTLDQKVGGSNPSGRAIQQFQIRPRTNANGRGLRHTLINTVSPGQC